jgi:hypothetical protein
VLGSYRKKNLWDTSTFGNEHLFWSRGSEVGIVLESRLGKIGLMICIEMYHDFGLGLAKKGADFLATVSAWPGGSGDLYETKTTSNARAVARWHFVANQTGTVGHSTDYGHSRIINPNGVIIADTGANEGMVVAETDMLIPMPVIDFNGDGNVDGTEVLVFAAHWGQNEPACDIAPVPFGDGIVDVEDLRVLAEYIGRPVDDPTLIAHWAFDETEGDVARDDSYENDAAIFGGATWRAEDGVIDGALEFNGVDAYVETPSILNPADGPFSVVAWVQGGGPGQVLIAQADGANWLMIDVSRETLATDLMPPPRRVTVPPLVSEAVITDNTWHRVASVWDGANRSLYVDGTLVAADEQESLEENSGGLYIGCGADQSPESFFTGLIDDIRIYNRAVKP